MITLVLIVCLATAPDFCKEVPVPADLSLVQCMMYGQPIAAEMLKDMPKYTLQKWECKVTATLERKA